MIAGASSSTQVNRSRARRDQIQTVIQTPRAQEGIGEGISRGTIIWVDSGRFLGFCGATLTGAWLLHVVNHLPHVLIGARVHYGDVR